MNSTTFEELLKHFENKIEMIHELIPLAKLYSNGSVDTNEWTRNVVVAQRLQQLNNSDTNQLTHNKPDLRALSEMTIEMKVMVEEMKSLLKQQKQELMDQNMKCENDLRLIARHYEHINTNIPAFLQRNNDLKSKSSKTTNETTTELAKSRTLSNKTQVSKPTAKASQKPVIKSNKTNTNVMSKSSQDIKVGVKNVKKKGNVGNNCKIPTVSFITTEEFSSIPNYMLGRLTYDVINRAIGDFNRTVNAKYKLISNYSTKSSDEEIRRYTNFKEQENSETDGEFFCTISDLKELSDLKVDNTIRKILTCLRHCKRIKEIRGNPPKLIRYAIIDNSVNTQNQSY